jgi:23S rRNA (uracil1939-C5)-methyltransferase
VLDPPRAGAKDVVSRFDPRVTQQVVYVSCDLPSLTRDLKILVERGYHFTQLFVVDMFPQTHHVETVAILRAASVGGRLKV